MQKGKLVSKEGRARRFARAQRIVKKALRVRLREEKRKQWWLERKRLWEQEEDVEVSRGDVEGCKGGEYREGPYRQ